MNTKIAIGIIVGIAILVGIGYGVGTQNLEPVNDTEVTIDDNTETGTGKEFHLSLDDTVTTSGG